MTVRDTSAIAHAANGHDTLKHRAIKLSSRCKDITGQVFGKLAAIIPVENIRHAGIKWLCDCECGKTSIVLLSNLTQGSVEACGCLRKPISAEDRFNVSFIKTGPTQPHMETNCWEWTQQTNPGGYGSFSLDGKTVSAHRIAWEIHNGEIPEHDSYHGLCVCHKCDNKKCVNPDHLFLTDHKGNMDDREAKGRDANHKGIANGNSKLNDIQVRVIRSKHPLITNDELCDIFSVSKSTIWRVLSGTAWTHLNNLDEAGKGKCPITGNQAYMIESPVKQLRLI